MNQPMNHIDPAGLCPEDQQAFDALIAARFDPDAVEPARRDRACRLAELLGLMDHLPAPSPGDLLAARTIDTVRRARQKERYTQQIQALSGDGRSTGLRWRELLAAAAVVLISVSLIWPSLNRARATARQDACQTNLAAAGMGFASYAAEHQGRMPAVKARPGDPWWHVNSFTEEGRTRSNSAHLFLLIRGGYLTAEQLTCPGNPDALRRASVGMRDWPDAPSTSFSYQNQFTHHANRLNRTVRIAILGDKNPLFQPGAYRSELDPAALSANHATLQVQNVLLSDGRVLRLTAPMVNGNDNIWQIHDKTAQYIQGRPIRYTGTETPSDENDSFLVP